MSSEDTTEESSTDANQPSSFAERGIEMSRDRFECFECDFAAEDREEFDTQGLALACPECQSLRVEHVFTSDDDDRDLVADGGRPTLRFNDRGIEIPDGVDLSDGVVFRARGVTVDHVPGSPDREFYPAFREQHLTAEGRDVINEDLDEHEVSIKPYGEEAETYRVAVAMADGGSEYSDPLEAVDGETEVEIECAVGIEVPRDCDGWCETVELDEPADYTGRIIELPGFGWECPECGNPHEFEVEGIRVSNLV